MIVGFRLDWSNSQPVPHQSAPAPKKKAKKKPAKKKAKKKEDPGPPRLVRRKRKLPSASSVLKKGG